ncbi:hypothetical protein JMN32_04305 [Fulvivirga sp. 29W222]|uniref:Outer membrane protein beta-barrel domain-containing protein n=1 Tax=Fulvivirga marina TaxID=2494733 RepID=A0A937KAI4_9BACT|nr:hypothetical protein [Fulvivirga marina]MBL6445516.1 hypothetical protein [Fulvivirga marina]
MKLALPLLLLLLTACLAQAQDKIHKKDKTIIDCKITEIGTNEIKYKLPEPELEESPIIAISVDEVDKVVLRSGREIEFKDPLTDPNSYTDNKKHAIKFHFISPLAEHLAFSYEKSIKPGRSFETELGIIGAGFDVDDYSSSAGIYISSGYKFLKTPDFYSQRMKYAHILKGSYVKPQVLLSVYRNKVNSQSAPYYNDTDQNIVAGALIINLGKQIVYDNFFLMDYSIGIGYGFSNQKSSDDYYDYNDFRSYHYGFILGDNDFPIAVTGRLKIGILLK